MFRRVSEVQNTWFESRTGAVEGGVRCCAFCDRCVQGWVMLEADGTMLKGCKSMLQNPMAGLRDHVRQTHRVLDYKSSSSFIFEVHT
eukprot:3895968-Ditylum_brightwellii.AAC.1